MDKINDNDIQAEVVRAKLESPVIQLKNTLLEFFVSRITKINEQEEFKNRVKDSLLVKIDEDKLTANQLINLFRIIYNETTLATESLLSVFKAQGGAISPLIQDQMNNNSNNDDRINKAFEGLSAKDNAKIDKLLRVVKAAEKTLENEDIELNLNPDDDEEDY